MALNLGDRLGHYDVTALIGEGGMGQVYQATDTKLNRQVALKILPEAFASDPDRLARFQREAQVLASLNHPGIAAIYGLEETDDIRALVLELVEGPTLADRIAQGPIPVDEAQPIAKQIAEALEAAHEAGVIHRDLKPANIKLRPDGTVKVLDFGLAKAMEGEGSSASESPTITAAATASGVILGTAAYMSPEQARGKPVDKRSDIWAFGAVLFEMLTGQRPFEGRDVSEVLGAVLRLEPDWHALPGETPPSLHALLKRCLEKEPRQRMRDIGDVRLVMDGAFGAAVGASPAESPAPQPAGWRQALPWVAGILLVLFTGLSVWNLTRSTPAGPVPVTRFSIALPPDVPSITSASNHFTMAFSPDGTHLAYVANNQLNLRAMNQLEATPIRGTEGALEPFFSPDGQSIGFWAEGQLKRVAVTGGAPVTIGETPQEPFAPRWAPDDEILFGGVGGVWQVSASGGTPEVVIAPGPGEQGLGRPQLLPGGEWVLFSTVPGDQVAIESLRTGERQVLVENVDSPIYVPTGHLVYVRDGTLLAQPFDVERRIVTPGPVALVETVRGRHFILSESGSLAYVHGGGETRALVWVNRAGEPTPFVDEMASYAGPRLSPDETRVAVEIEGDIWICESGRACQPFTTGGGFNPVWTPDGSQIAFQSSRDGDQDLYWKPVDGGAAERLLAREKNQFPVSWSPDGQVLAFSEFPFGDIFLLPLDGEPEEFVVTESSETTPMFSPDGRWIAYRSDDGGQNRVYVQPYPAGARTLVSLEGGVAPVWARDGRELFFRDGNRMMAVEVGDSETFSLGIPRVLFEGYEVAGNYDVTRDGQRFVMVRTQQESVEEIHVVRNWTEDLKRLVPVD